jgi:peptide/nickel transport system substrate-binding protein
LSSNDKTFICFKYCKLIDSKIMIVIILLVFISCREKINSTKNQTLTVGLEGNPTMLDPRIASDAYSLRILPLIFEGLVQLDENFVPKPSLAKSWEQPDPTTYIFQLQEGRKCPGGYEISARDVVETIKSLADPKLKTTKKALYDRIKSINKTDEYEVIITLNEPYAPFLTELNMGIAPFGMLENDPEFMNKPYGSGPYKVEKFERGELIILTVNPDYTGPAPHIKTLIFRILANDVTRVMALEHGDVDLLQNSVPPDDLAILKKNERIKMIVEKGINYSYIGFNLEDPILKNKNVRRAIAHAIDKKTIASCFLQNSVTSANSIILAPSNWAYEKNIKSYDFNIEKAQKLLDEAGYEDPDGNGPLPRFKLVYKTSQNKSRRWIAEAIADQLGNVGIEVEVKSYEWGTFYADIKAEAFQIYSLTWVGISDPDIYYWAFHTDSMPPVGSNRNRYSNPEVDRLTNLGRSTPDKDKRRMYYSDIQKILARDLPYIPLWYSNNIVAMDKRLDGFVIYPGGDYRSLAKIKWAGL